MNGIPDNSKKATSFHKWWWAIACTYAIYVLVYASVCLRTGLHWDEVLDYDGSAYGTYIAAGRWLTGAWRACTGSTEPAWLPGFTGGLVLSALAYAQSHMLGQNEAWKRWAFIILTLASIQWSYMLHYSFLTECVAIGMCCATAAAWLCYKPGWKCAIGAALLLAVAIGAYQTLAIYFGVGWLLIRLSRLRREEEAYSLRPWIRMACISVGGIAVWYAVHRVSLSFVSSWDLDYVERYQDSMTQWGEGFSSYGTKWKILCLLHYFRISVSNALGVGKETYWLFATSLLPLAGIIWQALRAGAGWRRCEQCAVALLVWWLPFSLTMILLSSQGFRTALAAPLSFAGLWMVWLAGMRLEKRHVYTLAIVGAGLVAAGAAAVYAQAREEAGLHRNSIALVTAMQERGAACARAAGQPDAPIVVLADIPKEAADFCGAYRMVAGTGCMNWYCRAYGIENMRMGTRDDKERHKACYEAMPSWPAEGCVRMDGDEVIIKATLEK